MKNHAQGHDIYYDIDNRKWRYTDNNKHVDYSRACARCGVLSEHDSCMGILPGVKAACCGHGIPNQGYILFNNGTRLGFTLHTIRKRDNKFTEIVSKVKD